MTNKRQQHTPRQDTTTPRAPHQSPSLQAHRAATRDELNQLSPVFRRLPQVPPQPAPTQWQEFSRELTAKLESTKTPLLQVTRDKITSTDSHILRWFWLIITLLILFGLAIIITLTLQSDPTPTPAALASSVQTQTLPSPRA